MVLIGHEVFKPRLVALGIIAFGAGQNEVADMVSSAPREGQKVVEGPFNRPGPSTMKRTRTIKAAISVEFCQGLTNPLTLLRPQAGGAIRTLQCMCPAHPYILIGVSLLVKLLAVDNPSMKDNLHTLNPDARVKMLVKGYTKKWVKLLDFGWFTIQNKFIDSGEEEDGGITRTAADTTALWQYRYAKIRWYLPNLANQTDEQIEECVVHELVHCLIASMEEHVNDDFVEQREYAVQTVALGLLACHRKSLKSGMKLTDEV